MRFYLLFAAAWTVIVAQEQSVVSIEDDPNPVDSGITVALQASNLRPPNAGEFVQDDDDMFNFVDEVNSSPPHSPDVESLTSNSRTPDDPVTDGNPSNLNDDFVNSASDSLTDTGNLETYCLPGNSATPGKLRKRKDFPGCLNRMDTDPETVDDNTNIQDIERLLQEDAAWKKEFGIAALKKSKSPCTNQGFRRLGACCLPPPEPHGVGLDGVEVNNYRACVPFLLGRPWCLIGEYCCQDLVVRADTLPGTSFGENCRSMTA